MLTAPRLRARRAPIIGPMHLLLPFAGAASPAAAQAASTLNLPRLERLLALLTVDVRLAGDELSLSAPHETVLAQALGWPLVDGLLPLAERSAAADGLATAESSDTRGWGLLSPCHWHLGNEFVTLSDPAELALDEAGSRQLFQALLPLFDHDGWRLLWGAPSRWYARHASLAKLPTASLDRVVGRNIDLWLTKHVDARPMRRLQAEAQMLLHSHPLNAVREEQGLLPVNSVWLSGTGPAGLSSRTEVPVLLDELRQPALAGDWTAWAEAWAALDAGPLARALAALQAGGPLQLSLCGERHAQTWRTQPRSLWSRWLGARRQAAAPVLESL